MKNRKNTLLFAIIVIFVGIFSFASLKGFPLIDYRFKPVSESIGKGLDLVGGISVVEKVQDYNISDERIEQYMKANEGMSRSEVVKNLQEDVMKRTVGMIEKRVNKLGISETVVAREGDDKIRIEIPGVTDSEEIINLVGKSGILKFIGPDGVVILTGDDVQQATAVGNEIGSPEVTLELSVEGKKKFEEATGKFIGQQIAIYLDEDLIVAPTVQNQISDGTARITNMESRERALKIANLINSGALPIALKVESYKTVGATLGANAVPLSAKAGLFGVLLVIIFMIAYYKVPGVIASIGLILFINLDMNIFGAMSGVLTLAGIAGLLLTIGMAVDANVLIFERIKEEIKSGVTPAVAIESGYKRAFWSIMDANVTTMIAALILYFVGTGAVKGFALTLLIGIAVSIFTALVFTKYMLRLGVKANILSKPSHFGVKRG